MRGVDTRQAASEADALSEKIWPLVAPILAGKDAEVQGAVLADLLAIWLAGHLFGDEAATTKKKRRELFDAHCQLVWELVELYDAKREQRW